MLLPSLKIGAVVRVFRTSNASPIWFYDPATGKCTTELTLDPYAVGRVAEQRGSCYRVNVLIKGRTYYTEWRSRHWIRLSHETAPDTSDHE